jgi:DNA mismatch repair protein MutS2
MNGHALAVLEFEEALGRVAARAPSALGREAVQALRPGTDPGAVQEELARVGEAVSYLSGRPDWAPPGAPDARGPLRVLSVEGGVLDPPGLLSARRLLEAAHRLRDALGPEGLESLQAGGLPRLEALRARLPHHAPLLERLEQVVDDDGAIRDGASPALRALRRRLRSARSRMVERLERFLDTLPDRIRVTDASVSVRDGRYVIPIRREGKSEVGGIIHGESATGATLFVEPPLAIRLMNEVQELEREEEREIQRILRDATGRLRAEREGLEEGLAALVDFDSLWARALAAEGWEASVPTLTDPGEGVLRIVRGRHPLLLGRDDGPVVPFDLELGPGERALVVSGPNTGGKTVFLKAVGLIHLLAQSGVAPPVGPGTRLPVAVDVFADIGDEQSIAESLSTFSAHLANTLEILEGAGPGTLVLMDEMGTGTDPAEGAALARAILETLVERGARAVVTSHLSALKRLDAEGSGIVNASLLFDAERIAPTYQLQKGRPGRSYGLAIARRMGLPAEVLRRAHGYVDSGELELEELLAALEEKERELSRALDEADRARRRAAELEREAEQREARVEVRERTAEARAREEARRLLLDARREVEDAIQEVRTAGDDERARAEREARRRVEEAARRQREKAPSVPGRRGRTRAPAGAVAPGERVRVLGSGAKGTVREVRDDRVTVEVGGLRLQLPRHEVEPVEGGASGSRPASGAEPAGVPRWEGDGPEIHTEADLRGLRVDEVELELGRALDGAVFGNLGELRIIHGKGTGAVKARVHELLRSDRRVEEFREGLPGEGGGGVTVARLR